MTLAGTFEFLAMCSGVMGRGTDRNPKALPDGGREHGFGGLKPNPFQLDHLLSDNIE